MSKQTTGENTTKRKKSEHHQRVCVPFVYDRLTEREWWKKDVWLFTDSHAGDAGQPVDAFAHQTKRCSLVVGRPLSLPLTFGVAQLISEWTRPVPGRSSNASFCAVLFFSAKVWEWGSDHGYCKIAVQALVPIGEQERDRQHEEEARKSEVGRDQPFAESFVSCRNSNFSQAKQVTFFVRELVFLIERTPDVLMQASTFSYKGKCWDVLRFWMASGWNRPRRDFREACMYRKWGECRKPSENVNRLASYSFADFWKPTGYFHSHLCLWQYFTSAKFAWLRKRPLLSTHAFAWS